MRTFEDRRAWEPQCPVRGRRAATTAGQGLRYFLLHDEHRRASWASSSSSPRWSTTMLQSTAPVQTGGGEAQKPARLETF